LAEAAPPACFRDEPGVKERSGRLLVRPRQVEAWIAAGVPQAEAEARTAAARLGLTALEIGSIPGPDIHILAVPSGLSEESLADLLLAGDAYEYAEPDWIVYPADTTPDDAGFAQQWQLRKIAAPEAWDRRTGDGSITMAFVDTGVDLTHPDLIGVLVPGFNAATRLTQAQGGQVDDVNGHGTSVLGAAAAMGNNAVGGSGVCWDVRAMPIRASNSASGSAWLSDILYGAIWGAYAGARIVSVSYSGADNLSVSPTAQAIRQQYGGVLFWAAGNSNACINVDDPWTTVVGSTDSNDVKAPDSNWGPGVDLVAPGVAVYVPQRGGGYGVASGTSFSAPIAAATLALAWSAAPWMNADQALQTLYDGCEDLGDPGRDPLYGRGRVNAARTLDRAIGPPPFEQGSNILPPRGGEGTIHGIVGRYYAVADVTSLPAFGSWPIWTTSVATIDFTQGTLPGCPRTQQLGAVFEGIVEAPGTGPYTFALDSTDGSRLWIDGVLVVNNDGLHPQSVRYGTVSLARGPHVLRCAYFTVDGPPRLSVKMRGVGLGDPVLPASLVSYFQATSSVYPPLHHRR
jgi:hypothetical protein